MKSVQILTVTEQDDGQRLDRWLKKHLAKVPYALIQKMVRTGQIRINGKRAKTDSRLIMNDEIRIPPVETKEGPSVFRPRDDDEDFLKKIILYDDGELLVLNKPYGLPVQGGPNITRHIESRDIKKIYYALISPIPQKQSGELNGAIIKGTGARKEAVIIDNVNGRAAKTSFHILAQNEELNIAWAAFWPRTGRMHQIRVHASDILGSPILGDEKYNGMNDIMDRMNMPHQLHLHAAHLIFKHPITKEMIKISAPLPDHMVTSFKICDFDLNLLPDPFDNK
jgi:23S rRNA pseudouridine955/2504/2580 synthase